VVLGGRDPLIPLRKGQDMAERIPRSRLEVLAHGGHVSMAENPETITRWLLEHMAEAMARGAACGA